MYDIIEIDDLIFESILLLPQAQKCGITVISDLSGYVRTYKFKNTYVYIFI